MEQLLRCLQQIPEVAELALRVEEGGCPAAVSGLAPVHRAQVAAALAQATGRPLVAVCGDERDAQRLAADLSVLTGTPAAMLGAREWQLTAASASRGWEQQRIAALYALARGGQRVVVATADALLQRSIPPQVLRDTAFSLELGGRASLKDLSQRLTAAGYSRAQQVEGVGQFALRGGILDVFSPGMEEPVRCEFFDDEIDSMGVFDPGTQRRTRNIKSALVLPAMEVLPALAPGGIQGLAERLEALAEKAEKKKAGQRLAQTLAEDAERLRNGAALPGADRYLHAVYPGDESSVDYLPKGALVFFSESGRVTERVKSALWQWKQDTETLLSAGTLAGELAHLSLSAEELWSALEDFPVVMADALPTSRYPLRPRGLLSITANVVISPLAPTIRIR